ncbi:siderophore ABC transporter substrate-binding protein [Labrenzia sp. CE80]|uniref:siderophore ABC transporter substrate-binding protein n=1 Tax=Labrenzia sp. CE80 TaxID=1788986 RepID=UPI00129B76D7|nr:siderophore ABC transporter substrate-binding protein [Labrenzia sp. CE80]
MRAFRWAAVILACGLGSQIALADALSIETARGNIDVPRDLQKLVVFDIAALDTLNALGVSVAGTPEQVFVDYLKPVAKDAEKVGSLFEPDFEAINALQPDLIVAGGRSSKQVEALSEFAPTIDMTIWGDGLLTQAIARLHAYGSLFGKEDAAQELEDDLNSAVNALKAQSAGAGKALIVLTNGPKISVYGKGSRFGWLHTELGIEPAIEDVKSSTHGEAVSFEFIRDANPDWLIVIDRAAAIGQDAALAAETLDNKLVAETTAWKSGQVIFLDASKVYIAAGGYQSLMGTLAEISDAFQKAN